MRKGKISVAIVDDNPEINKQTEEKLKTIFQLEIFEHVDFLPVAVYEDGKHLLDSKKGYDIVLMDYEMPDMNGIETARELDKRGVNTKVLFLSGYPDITGPLQQSTSIKLTAGFIFKSAPIEEFQLAVERVIKDVLDVYLITIKHYEDEYDVDKGKDVKVFYETMIDAKQIVTIEAKDEEAFIYTKSDEFLTQTPLKSWLLQLPMGDFCYVSKSCLLHLKYVQSHSGTAIQLTTGDIVKLGRYYKTRFKKAYENYVMREAMK